MHADESLVADGSVGQGSRVWFSYRLIRERSFSDLFRDFPYCVCVWTEFVYLASIYI